MQPNEFLKIIRDVNDIQDEYIPLHAPVFFEKEREFVIEAIDSTFVSSVGSFVDQFEKDLSKITGAKFAVATVNGTAALHLALLCAGVAQNDLVITQSFSFIATANAIRYAGANPVFIDIDPLTLGMSAEALRKYLETNCQLVDKNCILKETNERIKACVPMHAFGFPCEIEKIANICKEWNIALVEDAAEALGSSQNGRHCGAVGIAGTLSFNGNKIITTGGGGAIITDDPDFARQAKHLSTTAKLPHKWRFIHDEVGFNYRMPNINAALGCAQLISLDKFIHFKRDLAESYKKAFANTSIKFLSEPEGSRSNYWLCSVLCESKAQRDELLEHTNANRVMTRPAWDPLHTLSMFNSFKRDPLKNTEFISDRLINIPSGYHEV